MCFCIVGSDAGNKPRVVDCASGRDCEAGYEKYRVCTRRHSSANVLSKLANVIRQACFPDVLVGATHQMRIFKGLASVRVDHGVGVVCAAMLSSDEVPSGSRIMGAGGRRKTVWLDMAMVLAAM